MRSKIALVIGLLLVVLSIGVWVDRHIQEGQYVTTLSSAAYNIYTETGVWPRSLATVEQRLRHQLSEGGPVAYEADFWLRVHAKAQPELRFVARDEEHDRFELRFRWLFGGRYPLEVPR